MLRLHRLSIVVACALMLSGVACGQSDSDSDSRDDRAAEKKDKKKDKKKKKDDDLKDGDKAGKKDRDGDAPDSDVSAEKPATSDGAKLPDDDEIWSVLEKEDLHDECDDCSLVTYGAGSDLPFIAVVTQESEYEPDYSDDWIYLLRSTGDGLEVLADDVCGFGRTSVSILEHKGRTDVVLHCSVRDDPEENGSDSDYYNVILLTAETRSLKGDISLDWFACQGYWGGPCIREEHLSMTPAFEDVDGDGYEDLVLKWVNEVSAGGPAKCKKEVDWSHGSPSPASGCRGTGTG